MNISRVVRFIFTFVSLVSLAVVTSVTFIGRCRAQTQTASAAGAPSVASVPAAAEHQLIRRVVVFPLQVAGEVEAGLGEQADEAWWQAREELTKSRRFLVASKQFLMRSDAFQARGELEPADAILLGRLLDAHAILTLKLEGRKLTLRAYDGANGFALYIRPVSLHPSVTTADQLASLSRKLIRDFIATLPYQGHTVVDSLVGHAVFQEGDAKFADIEIGVDSAAKIGDVVQWVRIEPATFAPVFQGGSRTTVYADGKIVRINEGQAVVEILRATVLKDIREFSLVRLPKEAERLASEETLKDLPKATVTSELISPEANPLERVAQERRPLLTALSFVGSIGAFMLLAF